MFFLVLHAWILILLISTTVLALMTVGRHAPLPHRLLKWLNIFNLLIEIAAIVLAERYHNNQWLLNLAEIVETLLLLLIFYLAAVHPVTRWINRGLLWLLPVGVAVSYILHPGILRVNIFSMIFFLFAQLLCTGVFLVDGLARTDEHTFFDDPLSWTAAGIALHTFTSAIGYGMWDFILKGHDGFYNMEVFVANGAFYGGIIITFIHLRKIKRQEAVNPYL